MLPVINAKTSRVRLTELATSAEPIPETKMFFEQVNSSSSSSSPQLGAAIMQIYSRES